MRTLNGFELAAVSGGEDGGGCSAADSCNSTGYGDGYGGGYGSFGGSFGGVNSSIGESAALQLVNAIDTCTTDPFAAILCLGVALSNAPNYLNGVGGVTSDPMGYYSGFLSGEGGSTQ